MKLTGSQVRSLLGGIVTFVATLNENWHLLAGVPGLHIPPVVTVIVQAAGIVFMLLGRSLDKTNSGSGTGLVALPASSSSAALSEPPAPMTPAEAEVLINLLLPKLPAGAKDKLALSASQLLSDALLEKSQSALTGLSAAADARADAPSPPIMGEGSAPSVAEEAAASAVDTLPAPISREVDAEDAPKPVTELSQE